MKKAATKKAATKKPKVDPPVGDGPLAEGSPVGGEPLADGGEGAASPELVVKAGKPVKCVRPFRHEGRHYERGQIYTDLSKEVLDRFGHRFGDPKQDA